MDGTSTTCTCNAYIGTGQIGTELRASAAACPGDVLIRESAFAFAANEQDEDDESELPSIVQLAMNALEAAEGAPEGGRGFQDLTAQSGATAENWALFAVGARAIASRRSEQTESEALAALKRAHCNSFSVKRLLLDDISAAMEREFADEWEEVVAAVGQEHTFGLGLYLTASAANHSCSPNAYATFAGDHAITFRALKPIEAEEPITISYGPVVGVDGSSARRRLGLNFDCLCRCCTSQEESTGGADDEATAAEFIDRVIVRGSESGAYTAEEALTACGSAPPNIMGTYTFGRACADTALQTVPIPGGVAAGFQKLVLKSLELRNCTGSVAMAYEIIRLLSLNGQQNPEQKLHIGIARQILQIHHGCPIPYEQLLKRCEL